jgi:starch phosphorylase
VIEAIDSGLVSRGDTDLFRPLTEHLRRSDDYLLMADFRAYVDSQREVDLAFRDPSHWTRMSILNVARMAKFSSDRAIREYAEHIWQIKPLEQESGKLEALPSEI